MNYKIELKDRNRTIHGNGDLKEIREVIRFLRKEKQIKRYRVKTEFWYGKNL